MKVSKLGRSTLCVSTAVAMLAGCRGSQPPVGASATIPQQAHARKSPYKLLYLAEYNSASRLYQTQILSYPAGSQIGLLSEAGSMCADATGDVYIVTSGLITEYPPGSTSAIAEASMPSKVSAHACAVDPTTGNIAVTGDQMVSGGSAGWLGIYTSLGNSPTLYSDTKMLYLSYCGYDNKGDLFMDAEASGAWFAELPAGSSNFVNLGEPYAQGTVQWDGQYITIELPRADPIIYRLEVSGSSVTTVGQTVLRSPGRRKDRHLAYTWIDGDTVVAPGRRVVSLGYWHYPAGGQRYHTVPVAGPIYALLIDNVAQ